jgi:4-amino-4-deoxy-L-arabinose transferase-like glycosyltransferase
MDETRAPASGAWRPATALGALALAVFLLESLRPALGSDMRYVEACREMRASGDWLIPHLAFVPYFEKPILIYWLGAACQWLFGASSLASQLPSALAASGSVVVTYLWARSWRGATFAWWTSLLLLGSGMFLAMGSILTVDPLLAVCLTTAFFACFRHDRGDGPAWIWLFWLSAALGALAKGPLAWVLIACGIAPYLVLSRNLTLALRAVWAMRPLTGLAILLAVNVPWWFAVWRQDHRFVEFFFIHINLQGLTDANINHPGKPWFYLGILAIGLLPFTILIGPVLLSRMWAIGRATLTGAWGRLRAPRAATSTVDQGELYLWCTVLFPLLFLSASASKLPLYILPLLPGCVLLAADGLRPLVGRPPRWMFRMLLLELLLCLPAVVIYLAWGFHPEVLQGQTHADLALLGAGLFALFMSMVLALRELARSDLVRALGWLGCGGAMAALLCGPFITDLRMTANAAPLARYVAAHRQAGDRVVVASALAQDYEIVMALRERVQYCGAVRELGMGHFTEVTPRDRALPARPDAIDGGNLPENRYLLSEAAMARCWVQADRIWVFSDAGLEERLREAHLRVFEVARTRKALLLSNRPAQDMP